jgi:hypothetical protein
MPIKVKPLTEVDILRIVPPSPHFLGVYPANVLPTLPWMPCSFICNTHYAHLPGEHWVLFHFNDNGYGEYYDPLGIPPLYAAWEDYLEKNSRHGEWIYINKTVQDPLSNACGYHAIYYLLARQEGRSPLNIMKDFSSSDFVNNDIIVVTSIVGDLE